MDFFVSNNLVDDIICFFEFLINLPTDMLVQYQGPGGIKNVDTYCHIQARILLDNKDADKEPSPRIVIKRF